MQNHYGGVSLKKLLTESLTQDVTLLLNAKSSVPLPQLIGIDYIQTITIYLYSELQQRIFVNESDFLEIIIDGGHIYKR
jgi:hypothetical protein